MRMCKKCDTLKDVSEFGIHKKRKDGLRSACKKCIVDYTIGIGRTKSGLINKIYNSQKKSSKRRGHSYPEYSLCELKEWLLKDNLYNKLYIRWHNSSFDKNLIPSLDRIDNNIGYTFDNIRLCTWKENNKNARKDQSIGILSTGISIKPVIQYSLDGKIINKYFSMSEAKRATGISHISSCCSGKRKTAGGFMWKIIS